FRRLGVVVRDGVSPQVKVNRTLARGWLSQDRPTLSFTAADNVGVQWLEGRLDGKRIAFASRDCLAAQPNVDVAPCSTAAAPLELSFDAAGLSDGPHSLVLSAGDIVGNQGQQVLSFRVDHTAPVAPRGLMPIGSGWRRENRFDVSWTNPPE